MRHPFVGNQGDWHPDDKPEEYAFGRKAVFTEHPTDSSNRFLNFGFQFSYLPKSLRKMFTDTFTDGLSDPSRRPGARMWARELWNAIEMTVECPFCARVTLISGTAPHEHCMLCESKLRNPAISRFIMDNGSYQILSDHGRKIYPHHMGSDHSFDFSRELAEIQYHQKEMQYIFRNLSLPYVKIELEDGKSIQVRQNQGFRFSGVRRVIFQSTIYNIRNF